MWSIYSALASTRSRKILFITRAVLLAVVNNLSFTRKLERNILQPSLMFDHAKAGTNFPILRYHF